MTQTEMLIWATVCVVGLLGSAAWSGLETGIYSLGRVRLGVLAVRGGRGSAAWTLRREMRRPESVLATILLGNNGCNYLGTLGVTGLLEGAGLAPAAAAAIQVAILTPTLLVLGESVPKEVFRVDADRLTPRLAGVLVWTRRLLTLALVHPLVLWFASVVERTLASRSLAATAGQRERTAELLEESEAAGVISAVQSSLAERAIAFTEARVGQVMTPWATVAWLRSGEPIAAARARVGRTRHTRLPVVDAAGRVTGVAHVLDVLTAPDPALGVESVSRPPARLTAGMSVREALGRIREAGLPLGIVERGGRPVGVVSGRDLLRPLLGA